MNESETKSVVNVKISVVLYHYNFCPISYERGQNESQTGQYVNVLYWKGSFPLTNKEAKRTKYICPISTIQDKENFIQDRLALADGCRWCLLVLACWSGYSPLHPYVRTHPDLARLYDTDRSMERTHSGDIPKAPTSIGIQHQSRDVARYSTPAERCSYEASTSTDVPWCWPRQLDRPVVPSHTGIQIPKVEPTDRLSAPRQRESCANKTRISLVFPSWENSHNQQH